MPALIPISTFSQLILNTFARKKEKRNKVNSNIGFQAASPPRRRESVHRLGQPLQESPEARGVPAGRPGAEQPPRIRAGPGVEICAGLPGGRARCKLNGKLNVRENEN